MLQTSNSHKFWNTELFYNRLFHDPMTESTDHFVDLRRNEKLIPSNTITKNLMPCPICMTKFFMILFWSHPVLCVMHKVNIAGRVRADGGGEFNHIEKFMNQLDERLIRGKSVHKSSTLVDTNASSTFVDTTVSSTGLTGLKF